MKRLVGLLLGCGVLCGTVVADGIHPVTLRLNEQEPGRFLVQWRVPKQIPAHALPSPVLPETCRAVSERSVVDLPSAWFVKQTYRCPGGLSGRSLGIEYPFLNVTVATLLKVELMTGEQYAHMLAPGEQLWSVPEARTSVIPAWLRTASEGVLHGLEHFLGNGLHLTFLLSLLLLGAIPTAIRLATVFAVGQLASVLFVAASGFRIDGVHAEIGVAVATVLLAREALRPTNDRRQLSALAACAGLAHGLGIATPTALESFSIVLGMDATLLLSIMSLAGLASLATNRLPRVRLVTAGAYGVAALALGLALVSPTAGSGAAAAEPSPGLRLPNLPIPEELSSAPGSRRVASAFPEAALQSFVALDAFEVRHEVLVRLSEIAAHVDLGASELVDVEDQDEVGRRVRDLVGTQTRLEIDGQAVEPADVRVGFLRLDERGAVPRPTPVSEPVADAWIGVTTVYSTESTPREVTLVWTGFDLSATIPATFTDPESSRSIVLAAGNPELRWKNELLEDPAPVVMPVSVEAPLVWIPVLSLLPLGAALACGWAAVRGRRRLLAFALARVLTGGAIALALIGGAALPLPFLSGSAPDPARAKQILARLLPNVYRAFEFPTESATYDRLALSVTGDTLRDVYLEHRRAVRMEDRGGATARIEAVEVGDVSSVDPAGGGGFIATAGWTVGGMVIHFGHRHFRQNRYDARVAVVPVDGHWKIRSIEVLDEERLR